MTLPVRSFVALLLTALLAVPACAQPTLPPGTNAPPAPTEEAPSGLLALWNPATSPFIPIPEIGTDPNSGTTYGILPVFLTSRNEEITRILAPDFTFNSVLGYGANYRLFAYPSRDEQWSIVAGAKQHVERGLDMIYSDGLLRQTQWSTTYHLVYDRSGTQRFFGIGNNSPQGAETNYTLEQGFVELRWGWNLNRAVQIAFDIEPRLVQVERGAITTLPSTEAAFPGLRGLGQNHELLSRLFIAYDTRDSTIIPTHGGRVLFYAGFADRALLSSASYSFFGIDLRQFVPLDPRIILAGHLAARYMPVGSDVPFWDLSQLGGDRSIPSGPELLRGFGAGRFVDKNLFSASLELRNRLFDLNLFSTNLTFEVAPFIDVGRVFSSPTANPLADLHKVGGIGFRGLASPFIVGYVDIGYGSEGAAIFSGINYAF